MGQYFLRLLAFQTGLPEIAILDIDAWGMAAMYQMGVGTVNQEVNNQLIVPISVKLYITNLNSQLQWCTLNKSVNKAIIHGGLRSIDVDLPPGIPPNDQDVLEFVPNDLPLARGVHNYGFNKAKEVELEKLVWLHQANYPNHSQHWIQSFHQQVLHQNLKKIINLTSCSKGTTFYQFYQLFNRYYIQEDEKNYSFGSMSDTSSDAEDTGTNKCNGRCRN